MKPLHGGTKMVQRAGTAVPALTTKTILPVRVAAKGAPGSEGFRASMTVSRSRTALRAAYKPASMLGPGGDTPTPPNLSA